MVSRWSAVEADFLRHYNIEDALIIGWRRFTRLLNNLPFEHSAFFLPLLNAVREGSEYISDEDKRSNPKSWYKQQRDRVKGRLGKERNQISMDQFIQETRER
jgi:hypothetical protein|tara:strand:- start:6012 stop:6317 length:306 start_codon:yes stop_codon:yes gene_type:complete